jgi:hypothetical protein
MRARGTAAGCFALLLLAGAPAAAAKLEVSNRGVDGPTCGTQASPCRSLSAAIANAADGDTILVGPGRYGDLDGDGVLGEIGEETGGPACGCMVYVDKRLTILSRAGAAATLIDGSGLPLAGIAVWLGFPDSVFGRRNRGFTVTLSDQSEAGVFSPVNKVTIAGNWMVGGGSGVYVQGDDTRIEDERLLASSIFVQEGARTLVERSSALGAIVGIGVEGTGHVVERSVALGNQDGLFLGGTDAIARRSLFAGNEDRGVVTYEPSAAVESCSLFGNGIGGLYVQGTSAIATGNYWGAPDGPGPDPADEIGGPGGAATSGTPFATKEIRVKLRPLR